MSGLEMLFMDGGATVAGVLSAAAAVLGYKQQKEDDIELVDQPPDLELLRGNLADAYTSACAAHAAATAAWGEPLSLFRASGDCPPWAEAVGQSAKDLVDKASELEDLADVYDSQLQLALSDGKSLQRAPLEALVEKLNELTIVLTQQVPALIVARDAMSNGLGPRGAQAEEAVQAATQFVLEEPLPIAIMRERQLLGELWRTGPGRMEALARAIARRTGREPPESTSPAEEPDYASYVAAYL
ncbi:D27 [Symbiodinium natans]|uniref:D27 protein n=1 Tax=Symbiodinium natans TaxID=878477 RepID=A0A812RSW3_9DINO|nr:D27 [Symbiodinium natans]